jgi:hypothetical protein
MDGSFESRRWPLMTWKALIHGESPVGTLKKTAVQNPHQPGNRASTDTRNKLPLSKAQTQVRLLVELVKEKAWSEYKFQFADSEIHRVIEDTTGIEDCTDERLDSWASSIVIRMVQQRGQVPTGWTKQSRCTHCGIVWSDHGIDLLSCGWCYLRIAGEEFPRP